MRHTIKIAAGFVALLAFTSTSLAQAACTPLPPKKMEGPIAIVPFVRHSLSAQYFTDNGCDWAGNDQLNGVDAHVFDMTGIEGKTTVTVIAGPVGLAAPYELTNLNEACEPTGEVITVGSSGADFPQPTLVDIPVGTKWMIVNGDTVSPVTQNFATQVTVSVDFEGKACPAPEKKKKKKKR